MNGKSMLTIAKKDWIEVRQNKYAWIPMMIMPLIFVVIFPLIFTVVLPGLSIGADEVLTADADVQVFLDQMPPEMSRHVDLSKPMESMIVVVLGFMFAPMFLILPLMYAATIAAESFAGERERKTIEALLYTPATDADLLLGKVLAAAIPSMLITWAGFLVYSLILNIAPYRFFQRIWFPLPTWWPLIFWITPALVLMGIAVTVLISARVKSFMGAYQTSSSLVLVVVILFGGQLSGVLYLSVGVQMVLGAVLWVAALVLGRFAVRTFNRAALLTG
jgi:ABC-2 type transport system permease protein